MKWLTPSARWLAVALAILLLLQWLLLPSSPQNLSRDPGAAVPERGDPALDGPPALALGRVGADQMASIIDRPLFSQTRRPPPVPDLPEPVPVPVEAPPPPPPVEAIRLRLQAVIVGTRVPVVLAADQSGEMHRLRPGDEFDGWTLEEIEPYQVHFVNRGMRQTLYLRPEP